MFDMLTALAMNSSFCVLEAVCPTAPTVQSSVAIAMEGEREPACDRH